MRRVGRIRAIVMAVVLSLTMAVTMVPVKEAQASPVSCLLTKLYSEGSGAQMGTSFDVTSSTEIMSLADAASINIDTTSVCSARQQ